MPQKRVLVIEDDPDTAQAVAMLLRRHGHRVETAASGPDGLEAARTLRPEVVVCDLRLPGALDGLGVARALRSDPALSPITLIGLSGLADAEHRALAHDAGFDHFLAKPAPPDEILELVAAKPPG